MRRSCGASRLRARSTSRESNSALTSVGASSIGVPELPETETIARDLDREIAGARIVRVAVTKADVLREVSPRMFSRRVTGATIRRSWRRAKLIVLDLTTEDR